MEKFFGKTKFAAGLIATAALLAAGACSHAEDGRDPNAVPTATSKVSAVQTAPAAGSRRDGAEPPGCVPPHYSSTPRTIHPAAVVTGRAGVSPPARSLPPAKSSPPGSPREIPLHRMRPWGERCPPPASAPAARS